MNKKTLFLLLILAAFAVGAAVRVFVLTKNVSVIRPHNGQVVEAIYATGTVEPTIMVPIAARTNGYLTEIAAGEGQDVKKGDILARLEDSEQQATIADLNARLSFSQINLGRKQQLYQSKSISRDGLDSAQADVDSLKAQMDKAKVQAGYLVLVAPADGRIIRRDGEVGELIAASQPVFYLSCCAPLRITAEVDEEDIPQVKIGQNVLIQSDAFPDKVFQGKIEGITPKGDSVARSYRVRIGFDSPDHPFMIGMTAETNIIIQKTEGAILIPLASVGKGKKVQTVREEKIQTMSITTGIQDAGHVQIVSGLTTGDSVVVPFDADMKDGQKVHAEIYREGAK